jgi:hypothetical protein
MQVPPVYVPPDPSQIAPVLAQAESASMIAPRIEIPFTALMAHTFRYR